jgi:hypothetical protein
MFEASGFKFGASVSDNNHSASDLVFTSPCGVVVTVCIGLNGGGLCASFVTGVFAGVEKMGF